MSTKTTFKRVALVTVAALGFGMLVATPSQAVSTYTASATLSTTSLTVVGCTASASGAGRFYVDMVDDNGDDHALYTNESITVSVIAKPTSVTNTATINTDLTFQSVTVGAKGDAAVAVGAAATSSQQIPNGAGTVATHASNNQKYLSTATTGTSNRYYIAVYPNTVNACDQGAYTVRVRLTDSTGFVTDQNISVKFVTNAADSGAVFTIASAGSLNVGQALTYTTANYIKVTLKDASGGRVQVAGGTTGTVASFVPDISVALVSALDAVESLTDADSGIAAIDHVASTTAASALLQLQNQAGDGVYGVTDAAITSALSTTTVIRARYGSTSTTAALTIYAASTAIDTYTDLTLTAAGVLAADQLIKSDVGTTTAYTIPTTATSVKLRMNFDSTSTQTSSVTDQPMTVKTVWTGNYATASVSPATTTSTTTNTDSSGNIDLTITNSAPLAGAVATVTITGYLYTAGTSRGTSAGSSIVTLTWAAPIATTLSVIDPVTSVKVKTGTTNVLTVSVKDQFGNLMAGESLQPSLSSTSSNYSASTTYAAITTGTAGTATFSLTDAVATTATSDAVSFASVSNSAATAASFTLSYVATLPVVSTMTGYYNSSQDATTATTLIPSTGIYGDTASAKLTIVNARNQSLTLVAFDDGVDDDMVFVRFRAVTSTGAAATGAAVTLTVPTGGHVLNSSGLPATSRTLAVDASGDVTFRILATAPGTLTWTATSGTVTSTVTLVVATPAAAAGRTVAITGASTGTAFGSGVPMTATVKDRHGNLVSGATLTLSATGVGSFAGGATTQSFTTDSTGSYTFMATSNVAAGGVGTFKVSSSNSTDASSVAGYVGATVVDSTLAAGKSSATADVTFGAGEDPATANAQAATDAAAEATDAANAATDAANAAAEAADAATAAAQDAADAVAALSAQVATLISDLKAQLTALTNLVIKIQKKVKA
jgi:hypothetical protein